MFTLCTEGIRRFKPIIGLSEERLPITFLIMSHLHTVFSNYPGNYRDVMIWATYCLAYTLDLLELVNLQLIHLLTLTFRLTCSYQGLPQITTYPNLLYR